MSIYNALLMSAMLAALVAPIHQVQNKTSTAHNADSVDRRVG